MQVSGLLSSHCFLSLWWLASTINIKESVIMHTVVVSVTVQDSQIYVSSAPQWTFQVGLGKLKMTTVVYEMVISAFTLLCTDVEKMKDERCCNVQHLYRPCSMSCVAMVRFNFWVSVHRTHLWARSCSLNFSTTARFMARNSSLMEL